MQSDFYSKTVWSKNQMNFKIINNILCMEFIQHTFNWIKGEIFEGILIAVFGLITVVIALLFWKFGTTPNAKAIIIPLLVVGLFSTATGVSMYFTNQKRLVDFEINYKENPETFIVQEKERVESFMYMYDVSNILVSVCLVIGIATIWIFNKQIWQAIGIALVVFGLALYVIDYFSKERAETYYEEISAELTKN